MELLIGDKNCSLPLCVCGEMAKNKVPIALKMYKSMAYIINESGGDFEQGGCLYKPTSGIQWTSKYSWMSDRPQKQASEKQTSQCLTVVLW